jgi:VanZ family protein
MIHFIGTYWKSLLVCITILFLSFMNPPSIPSVQVLFSFDKIGHLGMYAIFTFLLLTDTSNLQQVRSRKPYYIWLGIAFPVFVGGMTELLQTLLFAPRAAEWGDFVADVAGVAVGWLLFFAWQKWRPYYR